MNLYEQNILDHYRAPRNVGRLRKPVYQAEEANRSCGDKISVFLKLDDGVISKIKFIGHGCAISQAAISILTEELLGKKATAVLKYNFTTLKKILGIAISERRYNCAMLGLRAIQTALKNYETSK